MNDLSGTKDVSEQVTARIRTPKPDWLRVKAPTSPEYAETRRLMRGLRLNTVSRWELGRQCPSAYDLARHCAALGVSVARLLPPAHDSAVRDQEHDQPAALG